ncbi:Snf7-domain-containing protein [Limtongia smithiae]|uniref:Snf7-domain-containing protein n=1 Tax=Limtongia smithiae TaxID=1125753 RepID=UPI0034CE6DA3
MYNMLSSIFGRSSGQKDAPKKTIVELRSQLELLIKREKYTEQKIAEQAAIARKNAVNNKAIAKQALRRKRMFEQDLDRLQGQIASLEIQTNAIESANLNLETMKAMQSGAKAMKQIHGNLNIDKVDATMDEIRDQVAVADEIGDAISRPLGEAVDDDELEDELEAMQQEELDAKMLNAGSVPSSKLPAAPAPVHVDAESEDDEEEELRKLQREMAI